MTLLHNPRRRRLLSASLLFGLLPIGAGCATEVSARPSMVDLTVVARDSGQDLPVYRHGGRAHVAGTPGARYALRLTNRSAQRQLVVLSVDGVNVISGETAGWHQTGYVLDPWQSFDIAGWRKSNTAVAAFEFAALSDSYATRTGRPDNVGVIGMAVFAEKPPAVALSRPRAPSQLLSESANPGSAKAAERRAESAESADRNTGHAADSAAAAAAPAPTERLGTAHGQREWSVVRHARFERVSHTPQAVVEIAYDSHRNLVAAGVIPSDIAHADPTPFPRSVHSSRFVADPPPR